jgi:hypothetical protein
MKKKSGKNVNFSRFKKETEEDLDSNYDHWVQLRNNYPLWVTDAENYYKEQKCLVGKIDPFCKFSYHGRNRQYPCLAYEKEGPVCYDPQGEYWVYTQPRIKESKQPKPKNLDLDPSHTTLLTNKFIHFGREDMILRWI